jgi:hypothetical protein
MAVAPEKAHRDYSKCSGATAWSRIEELLSQASLKDADARLALFHNLRQSLPGVSKGAGPMTVTAH